jgi:hypothetical protein
MKARNNCNGQPGRLRCQNAHAVRREGWHTLLYTAVQLGCASQDGTVPSGSVATGDSVAVERRCKDYTWPTHAGMGVFASGSCYNIRAVASVEVMSVENTSCAAARVAKANADAAHTARNMTSLRRNQANLLRRDSVVFQLTPNNRSGCNVARCFPDA